MPQAYTRALGDERHEQTDGTGDQKSGVNVEELKESMVLGARIMEAWQHESRSSVETRSNTNALRVVLLNDVEISFQGLN